MLIVSRIELDEHGVGAGGEVAFHDFRDLVELGHRRFVHRTALELDTDVGAGAEAEELGVHLVATADDDAALHHPHHALVDGGTRNAALRGDFFEAPAGIYGDDFEYFAV